MVEKVEVEESNLVDKEGEHCKNKLVVLTRVVTLVADKLERQWL